MREWYEMKCIYSIAFVFYTQSVGIVDSDYPWRSSKTPLSLLLTNILLLVSLSMDI